MPIAILESRSVARVAGPDAAHFLDNLLTSRTPQPGAAAFAALLTPQGKIIADMIVVAVEGGFLLDTPRATLADLLKRLTLYRLRSKVEIAALDDRAVAVGWGDAIRLAGAHDDPRLPALGWRAILPADVARALADTSETDWQAHRIRLGVPEGGQDFLYGDAFPHEADMDQLHGIDFAKGCYVGQEIVSRMQHRGTARTRVIPFAVCGPPPPEGTPIRAGGKEIGRVGSGIDGRLLALVRLDRLEEARLAGHAVAAGDKKLSVEPLAWARFPIPGASSAA